MTFLKDQIARVESFSKAGYPRSPTTRTSIERSLEGMAPQCGSGETLSELRPFLRQMLSRPAGGLKRSELNRILRGAWCEECFDVLGLDATARTVAEARRSSDQALIEGYLSWFPAKREVMPQLAAAARIAADRHDWAWKRRSHRWSLFDPKSGPAVVGRAVVTADNADSRTLLGEVGIGSHLAATGFGRAAFEAGCDDVATLQGARAVTGQLRLIGMFDRSQLADNLPALVRALLQPWISAKPDADHRKALSAFLLDQIGDPRSAPGKWKGIVDSLTEKLGERDANAIIQVFRRWLTDVTVREFFRAIARTTDRPDQWKQREAFWLAYLDAELVSEAWPALGQRARQEIQRIMRQSGERPESAVMMGGPAGSSALIMQIGDTRIAEWSDNGSCRFWDMDDPKAPPLYRPSYDGTALRTTVGRADFEYHSHVPASPGWEGKFAGVIYRRSNVMHPRFGRGRAARSW